MFTLRRGKADGINGNHASHYGLKNFLSHTHRRKYPNKTTIIHEGDKCETLYYIVSGSVSVVLEDEEGKEAVIAYLNPGDFFWGNGSV